MHTDLPLSLQVLFASIPIALSYLWFRSRKSVPLPPGPKGQLIAGSAAELRDCPELWLKFAEYADQHGPLISVRAFHTYMFVISDPNLVSELFDKRATNYSDRDVTPMMKLVGWDKDVLFLQYGPLLKQYRAMLQRALNHRVSLDYVPLQEHEGQRFMKHLLETPKDFMAHANLMSSSIAIRIAYGYSAVSSGDEFIQQAEEIMAGFSDAMIPGKWAVDIFPFLRHIPSWFPFAEFQRQVEYWKELNNLHKIKPFEFVLKEMAAGTAQESFSSKLLRPEEDEYVDDEMKNHIKTLAANLYGAGSDTTVSSIQSFFLAMTLYPEVQAKAQDEIAAYLKQRSGIAGGTMLLPADRSSLPYTNALAKELLRWHPVLNLVSHRSSDADDCDVVSNGRVYRIPARSTVLVNVWRIMHDPQVYPEPERFMPERYLVDDPPPNPENYAFGFGRRSCPGIHVAQQSIWIAISNTLSNFTITKAKNEREEEIVPEEAYSTGFISHPLPFECTITPKDGCEEWMQSIVD